MRGWRDHADRTLFEEYDEAAAKDKCIAMIEYLKEYWRGRFLSGLERRGMTEEEILFC